MRKFAHIPAPGIDTLSYDLAQAREANARAFRSVLRPIELALMQHIDHRDSLAWQSLADEYTALSRSMERVADLQADLLARGA